MKYKIRVEKELKEGENSKTMRKKLLSLLLIATMSLSLVACGGKKEETVTNNNTVTEEEPLMEVVEEDVERGEAVEENTGYARSPKWDEIEQKYMAVQIQDYFFENGMTVQELYDMVKDHPDFVWKSNLDDHTYNPDELISVDPYGTSYRLDFGPEVIFGVYNPNDVETPLKDCICTGFELTLRSADNYVFGYNGMNEILYKWTVDDIKGMMEPGGIFEGFEVVNESPTFFDIENANVNHEYLNKCLISFQVYEKEVEYISIKFPKE